MVTALSCAERFIGFLYRIFLSRNLGAEAVGIYQITLSVFGVLLTVASSGIPITVSRMITKFRTQKNPLAEKQTVSGGIFICLLFTISVSLIITFFPKSFSFVFSDSRCMDLLLIILPGLSITSIYAVIRGFFWGNKLFTSYSLIEFIEEAVMFCVGIFLIKTATSPLNGVMRAGVAIVASYAVSFVLSIAVFFKKGGKLASPLPQLKPLINASLPITAMRTSTSLINSLVAVLLPIGLINAGIAKEQAIASYGELSGMAIPLLFIPSTVIGAIALVLVPELSENYYNNNNQALKNNIEKAINASVFISCLIVPVFISHGKEIGNVIYKNQNAGVYLSYSAGIMLPMSLSMITTSLLNSINKEKSTLLYYFFGASATVLSVYFLPRFIGTYSYVVGLFLSYFICAVLNLYKLFKSTVKKPNVLPFIGISIIIVIVSTAFGFTIKSLISKAINNVFAYFISMVITTVFVAIFYAVFFPKKSLDFSSLKQSA